MDEVDKEGLCGMEVVEVSPHNDNGNTTSFLLIVYLQCLAGCHGRSWNYGHTQEHYQQGGCSILVVVIQRETNLVIHDLKFIRKQTLSCYKNSFLIETEGTKIMALSSLSLSHHYSYPLK